MFLKIFYWKIIYFLLLYSNLICRRSSIPSYVLMLEIPNLFESPSPYNGIFIFHIILHNFFIYNISCRKVSNPHGNISHAKEILTFCMFINFGSFNIYQGTKWHIIYYVLGAWTLMDCWLWFLLMWKVCSCPSKCLSVWVGFVPYSLLYITKIHFVHSFYIFGKTLVRKLDK